MDLHQMQGELQRANTRLAILENAVAKIVHLVPEALREECFVFQCCQGILRLPRNCTVIYSGRCVSLRLPVLEGDASIIRYFEIVSYLNVRSIAIKEVVFMGLPRGNTVCHVQCTDSITLEFENNTTSTHFCAIGRDRGNVATYPHHERRGMAEVIRIVSFIKHFFPFRRQV